MTSQERPDPLYPPIEPNKHGLLDVGDGDRIYWEECGNPHGKPALFVHGGPGCGSLPARRRNFDPDRYRAVLFDQRGCGRSTPHASDPSTDLQHNTTDNLIADMERLREHLEIDRWLLQGGSWGSTLMLAYAQRYPARVSELVIVGVTSGRRAEIDWLYRDVGRLFPEQWEAFRAAVPEAGDHGDILTAYGRRMVDPDPGCGSGPRTPGALGRTPCWTTSRTGRPERSGTGRRPIGWPWSACARTTSPTTHGWPTTSCCAVLLA